MDIISCLEKSPHIPISESIGKFDDAMMSIACFFFFVVGQLHKDAPTEEHPGNFNTNSNSP